MSGVQFKCLIFCCLLVLILSHHVALSTLLHHLVHNTHWTRNLTGDNSRSVLQSFWNSYFCNRAAQFIPHPKAETSDVLFWKAVWPSNFFFKVFAEVLRDFLVWWLNVNKSFVLVITILLENNLIDIVGKNNNIQVRSFKRLHKRRADGHVEVRVDYKVDLFLAFLHSFNVFIKTAKLFSVCKTCIKTKKSPNLIFIFLVGCHTFFDEVLEFEVPFLVRLWISFGFIIDQFKRTSGKHVAQLFNQARILVVFSGDIQW